MWGESDRSRLDTFSLQHSADISPTEWLPILATIPTMGILPASTEVVIVPSSEHCEFYGEPDVPIGKLYVSSSTLNGSPLFVRAKADAPKVCTGKIFFYSHSMVICTIQ